MAVLIDTNIILDYVLKREPNAEDAQACLDKLFTTRTKSWLTASTITDIYYVARRSLNDSAKAKAVVAKLLNAFLISDVDKTDCLNALELDMNDYEDALVSICAKKCKLQYIITQNVSDFTNSPIPAITPADYLTLQK
jgi:predicted nucleic acid-binding protein